MFAIASTWFSQTPILWHESSSAALISLVSAIEALLEKKSEICEKCNQPKFSVTKRFRAFLERYVPDVKKDYPEELKEIYRVRSDLAHGADLLLADLEYWNFMGAARQQRQEHMQWNFHQIASTALVNWVLEH